MAYRGPHKSRRMQGLPSDEELNYFPPSPHNTSQEGTLHGHLDSEVGSISLSNHHIEGEVETLVEDFLSLSNPPLTYTIGPPIVDLPSTRYVDHFTRYMLPSCPLYWSKEPVSFDPMDTIMPDFHSQVFFPNLSPVRGTYMAHSLPTFGSLR